MLGLAMGAVLLALCRVAVLRVLTAYIPRTPGPKRATRALPEPGLLALRATVYLALLGRQGLRDVSELCCRKAHYAAERLGELPGLELMFSRPFFKEFTLRYHGDATELIDRAATAGFDLGPALGRFPRLRESLGDAADQVLLVAVTEQRTREEIDRLVDSLAALPTTTDTPQTLGNPA